MTKNILNLSFDPKKNSNPQTVSTKQLDHLTRELSFRFDEMLPPESIVVLRGSRPDSSVFELLTVREGDNLFSVSLPSDVLSVAGRIVCDIACTANGEKGYTTVSSEIFVIENLASATNPSAEEMRTAVETIPAYVESALEIAKNSGEFDGKDGMSAYEYAVAGGFVGSESDFSAKLAQEIPTKLLQLQSDPTHLLVTQPEKDSWSAKADTAYVDRAQETAVEEAKTCGLFATPYIKRFADGIFAVTDISPLGSPFSLSVGSKNVIPFPYATPSKTQSGVTFTVNADGTITLNGTATSAIQFMLTSAGLKLEAGRVYTASVSGAGASVEMYIAETVSSKDSFSGNVTFVPTGEFYIAILKIPSGATFENATVKPQIELGTTATAFSVWRPNGGVTVSRYKGNLVPTPEPKTENGISYTVSSNGAISITGTATSQANLIIPLDLPAGKYTVSANNNVKTGTDTTNTVLLRAVYNDGDSLVFAKTLELTSAKACATFETAYPINELRITVPTGKTLSRFSVSPQLELGDRKSDFTVCDRTDFVADGNGTVSDAAPTENYAVFTAGAGYTVKGSYCPDTSSVIDGLTAEIARLEAEMRELLTK